MKKIIVLLVLLVSCAFAIYAQSEGTSPFSLTLSAEPAVQMIYYDDDAYVNRVTYGVLFGASCLYQYKDGNAVGLEFTTGLFPYSGFYKYRDYRISAAMRWRLYDRMYEKSGFSAQLYATSNVGVSIDCRDDSDIGCYLLTGIGLASVIGLDRMTVELDFNANITYQKGSFVLQLSPKVGVSVPIGGGR